MNAELERAWGVEAEWVCVDCAVVWPHLADPAGDGCERCGGMFVDPALVTGALAAA